MKMKRILFALILASAGCATAPASRGANDASAVQVMVLGTWHFAGSESDVIASNPDSPLTPRRQKELDEVADMLAAFKPTVIVTERVTSPPDYIDPKYAEFTPADLLKNKNERVQVAYRLAAKAKVARVLGIDEDSSEGEPDYFPYDKLLQHATKTGQVDDFNALMGRLATNIGEETKRLSALTMREALIEANHGLFSSPELYYEFLKFDVGEAQPAAELNAYWFMRNGKIFSKLIDVTKPGDRVIVVYGAGHKFWLEHLVEQTPGFRLVEPVAYLQKQ